MGSLTLTKENRLFWLGRYAERVYTSIEFTVQEYDGLIDGKTLDYDRICRSIGIPNVYMGAEDFCRRFTFDETSGYSIRSAADYMLGNGMVLRETISSQTLSYLQMAVYDIQKAAVSDAPAVDLQDVLDDITAFRGSFDDYIDDEKVRNIIKVGRSVERISLFTRLDYKKDRLEKELQKLVNRLYKTDLKYDKASLETIVGAAIGGIQTDEGVVLHAVETLIQF